MQIFCLIAAAVIGVPTLWIVKAVLKLSWSDIGRLILAVRVRRS